MKRNFEKLELGKSYRAVNGEVGRVIEINNSDPLYPIKVEFVDSIDIWFTEDGYFFEDKIHDGVNLIECLDNPTELTEQQAIDFLKSKNYTVFKNV